MVDEWLSELFKAVNCWFHIDNDLLSPLNKTTYKIYKQQIGSVKLSQSCGCRPWNGGTWFMTKIMWRAVFRNKSYAHTQRECRPDVLSYLRHRKLNGTRKLPWWPLPENSYERITEQTQLRGHSIQLCDRRRSTQVLQKITTQINQKLKFNESRFTW